jgi:hypothetical protein
MAPVNQRDIPRIQDLTVVFENKSVKEKGKERKTSKKILFVCGTSGTSLRASILVLLLVNPIIGLFPRPLRSPHGIRTEPEF